VRVRVLSFNVRQKGKTNLRNVRWRLGGGVGCGVARSPHEDGGARVGLFRLNLLLFLGRVRGGWGDFVVTEKLAKVLHEANDHDDRRAHQSDQEHCGKEMRKEYAYAEHADEHAPRPVKGQ
jgi:hypothetical protein